MLHSSAASRLHPAAGDQQARRPDRVRAGRAERRSRSRAATSADGNQPDRAGAPGGAGSAEAHIGADAHSHRCSAGTSSSAANGFASQIAKRDQAHHAAGPRGRRRAQPRAGRRRAVPRRAEPAAPAQQPTAATSRRAPATIRSAMPPPASGTAPGRDRAGRRRPERLRADGRPSTTATREHERERRREDQAEPAPDRVAAPARPREAVDRWSSSTGTISDQHEQGDRPAGYDLAGEQQVGRGAGTRRAAVERARWSASTARPSAGDLRLGRRPAASGAGPRSPDSDSCTAGCPRRRTAPAAEIVSGKARCAN